jgi:hypothetical protein
MAEVSIDSFTSPIRKLVRFFEKSRNQWKGKYLELKQTCKLLQNQARAVEKSRAVWRGRAAVAERRVAEMEREVERLKIGL